jgi:hypothetical protein
MHKHKAIVIVGKEGSGKTLLAGLIADAAGTSASVEFHQLAGAHFPPLDALSQDTVIVDIDFHGKGVAAKRQFEKWVGALKPLVSSEKMAVQVKHGVPVTIDTPNFIFCTGSVDALKLGVNERRFRVLNIEG